jgi:long-chain acyl-CoA synthetase
MAESPFVEQIMVVGSGEKFTGALIVPSFKALGDWCREQGISDTASLPLSVTKRYSGTCRR